MQSERNDLEYDPRHYTTDRRSGLHEADFDLSREDRLAARGDLFVLAVLLFGLVFLAVSQ